jgi:tetratricopeptide (TPR) repeat protein
MRLTDPRSVLSLALTLMFLCPVLAQEEPKPERGDPADTGKLVSQLNSRFFGDRLGARARLEEMGAGASEALLEALNSDIAGVRSGAALVLAVPEIVRLLDDPSPGVRRRAVEAIGELGTRAVGQLQKELEGAQGRRKELIEELLGHALETAVTAYIQQMMITEQKCLYCPGPVEELKELGPGALKALEELSDWHRQQSPVISYCALNTIGDLGDPATKDFLKKMYQQALSEKPQSMVFRAGAAMALAKLGEPDYAKEVIRDIKLDAYPSIGEAGKHSSLGATYLEMGMLDEAENEFREAKKLGPADSAYTFRLGCVYGLRGDAGKAVECLREALKQEVIKPAMLERIGYFKKIREAREWKEFVKEALKEEKAEESPKEGKVKEDDNKGEVVICPNCGKPNPKSAAKCPWCGEELKKK